MNYVILDDFEIESLQKKVNAYIEDGYRPAGGISAVNQNDGFIEYLQAMIKDTRAGQRENTDPAPLIL